MIKSICVRISSGIFVIAFAQSVSSAPHTTDVFATADTFELLALPNSTHGSAGALNVSGSQALNGLGQMKGITDTWIKYDTGPAKVEFDSVFGAGHWIITSAVFKASENAAPNNSIFGRGAGRFAITWMANDNWTQGNGTANSPGVASGTRIGFNYGHSILNAVNDELLGNNYQNDFVYGYKNYNLTLTPGFRNDLASGGPVSLYFNAVDPTIGFTFNSSNHSNTHWMILTADVNPALPCRGDLTGDRRIRGDDIDAFVDGYLNPGGLTPEQFEMLDMNDNDTLDESDISCFVSALLVTHNCDATGPFVCP